MNDWTSPVDIRPDHLEIVQDILHACLPAGFKVWVFGSRANWTTKDSSDLDLAVEGAGALDFRAMVRLEVALEESDLPYTVDVVDLNAVSPEFREIVEGQKVALFWSGSQSSGGGWCDVTLRDLVEIKHGYAFKGTNIHDFPGGSSDVLLTPGNFAVGGGFKADKFKYYDGPVPDQFVLNKGDLVVTMTDLSKLSDTLGYPALVPECYEDRRYLHNQRLGKISLKGTGDVDTRYLYYVMCTTEYRDEVLASATGTTVKHTSPERIGRFAFKLPPLPEQRAIAHILGTLDDKIELNRRMNQTLEEMARAVFQDWFVDFGPVRAKLEGREPYMPPDLWDLFPDRLVDSELGEVPEGWEVRGLDEIADYRNGLALQKFRPQGNEDRLPVVKIAQLRSGRSDGGEWAKAAIIPDCIIDDGDVVFSWSGSLMVKVWCGGQAALNQHLFKVTSREYPKWFYLRCIEAHLSDFQDIAVDKATTMGHIKREHLNDAKCVVPNQTILVAADETFANLLSQQISINLQSRALANQRDALLPKLVSGELRVSGSGRLPTPRAS